MPKIQEERQRTIYNFIEKNFQLKPEHELIFHYGIASIIDLFADKIYKLSRYRGDEVITCLYMFETTGNKEYKDKAIELIKLSINKQSLEGMGYEIIQERKSYPPPRF